MSSPNGYWYDDHANFDYGRLAKWLVVTPFVLILLVAVMWVGFGSIGRWNRERDLATDRKDITITATAEAEAAEARTVSEVAQAERLAERDRIRAQGQHDANVILQESLTDEYLKWYWIDGVRDSNAQLIYVPVDPTTGQPVLPITEAGRATP